MANREMKRNRTNVISNVETEIETLDGTKKVVVNMSMGQLVNFVDLMQNDLNSFYKEFKDFLGLEKEKVSKQELTDLFYDLSTDMKEQETPRTSPNTASFI